MIGTKNIRDNCVDCEDNWQQVGAHSRLSQRITESPRNQLSSRERYGRDGGLSPLRSPIRPEVLVNENKCEKMFSNRDTIPARRSINAASDSVLADSTDQNINSCWQNMAKHTTLTNEIEFPSLDALKFTPEKRKAPTTCDWYNMAIEMENDQREADRANRNRSKRRLMLSDESRDRQTHNRDDRHKGRKRRNNQQNSKHSNEGTPTKQRRQPSVPFWQKCPSSEERKEDPDHYEADNSVLDRRQKQLDLGKSTDGYKSYLSAVTRSSRVASRGHPQTPNKYLRFSRRSWDAQVKIWRRKLHNWDRPDSKKSDSVSGFSDGISDTLSEVSVEASITTIDSAFDELSSVTTPATPPNSQGSDPDDKSDVFLNDLLENVEDAIEEKHDNVIDVGYEEL